MIHAREESHEPSLIHLEGASRVLSGNQPDRVRWRIGNPAPSLGGRLLGHFAALPALDDPRVLLPLDGTSAGLRASLEQQARSAASPALRFAARLLAHAASFGMAAPVMRQRLTLTARDGGLFETPLNGFLADLLGTGEISLALRLAPGRPNGKPVIQAIGRDGAVLAYAKFGWEPLTRRLIRHEGRMLRALAGPLAGTSVSIPQVLHAGSWHDLETLVVTPVPSDGRMPRSVAEIPEGALRALAAVGRVRRGPLGESGFWVRLKGRIEILGPFLPSAVRELLYAAASEIEAHWGDEPLTLGLKHGDWIPPNMAIRNDGSVSIWDWERGVLAAPQGIDTLQFVLFQLLRHSGPDHTLGRRLQHASAPGLALYGLPATRARPLACLSLIETILWFGEAREAKREAIIDPRFPAALEAILDGGD